MRKHGEFLINKAGVKVHVSIERVDGLLAQGFKHVEESPEDDATEETGEYIESLEKMTKRELIVEGAMEGLELDASHTKNIMIGLILKAKGMAV